MQHPLGCIKVVVAYTSSMVNVLRAVITFLIALLVVMGSAPSLAQGSSPGQVSSFRNGKFKPAPGDRIAFFGDSLTRANVYPTIIEHHYRLLKPEYGLTFAQFGVDSQSSSDSLSRIDTDLVPFHPTVVVVFFGINDAGYRAPWQHPDAQQRWAEFQTNYPTLLNQLSQKLPGVRLVLCTTTVIDPVLLPTVGAYSQAGLNDVLFRYSSFISQTGRVRKLPVIDLYFPMLHAMNRGRALHPPLVISADGVHPTLGGYYYMATAFLEQWGEKKIAALK